MVEAEGTSFCHACGAGASGAENLIRVVTDAEEGGPGAPPSDARRSVRKGGETASTVVAAGERKVGDRA